MHMAIPLPYRDAAGPPAAVRVRVLLFAAYADALGCDEFMLALDAPATAGDVLAATRARAATVAIPPRPLMAVNARYASPDQVIHDGDEVALIPPVAGG
jgi:molybdopterin converting factor small subunit